MSKARDLANAATALNAVSPTELSYVDGVTSAIQTQLDSKLATATASSTYAPLTSPTLTAPVVVSPEERWTVSATAATGTINFDADTQGVLYYTTNSSANWTLNVRGSASTTLASKLAVGDSVTIAFIATNSTAYYQTALTIDGAAQTVKWSGGTAPSAGNASSTDVYQFTIIKTAATPTYTVLGSGPVKYA